MAQTFSWADGVPIYGAFEGQTKVTDDQAFREGDAAGTLTCDPGTGVSWPYHSTQLARVYQSSAPGDYDGGLWSLTSARDTAQIMQAHNMNLLIADVSGGDDHLPAIGTAEAAELECNWYSLAALDDYIASSSETPMFTGLALGPGSAIEDRWPCDSLSFMRRARREASDHPDVFKVVVSDELWRLLDGPETDLWEDQADPSAAGWNAHWNPDNVLELWDMAHSSSWSSVPDADSAMDPVCSGTASFVAHPVSHPVELRSRMISVGVPRYIVTAAVLGVPGDPAYAWMKEAPTSGWPTTGDYSFRVSTGDSASVTMEMVAPPTSVLSGHSTWHPEISFLWTASTGEAVGWELETAVNSVFVDDVGLDGDSNVQRVHIARQSPSSWDASSYFTNIVQVSLIATADTRVDQDRLVYVWAARVEYVDDATGAVFYQSAFQDMTGPAYATYAIGGSPGVYAMAKDTEEWNILSALDGVEVTHDISANQFDADAFDVLMEHTCEQLSELTDPKRCLVEERAAAFGIDDVTGLTAYDKGYFDLVDMLDRMESGDRWGDGVVGTYLPLEIDNVGTAGGRFGVKNPLDSSYDLLLYEPRLTRTLVSETHEYTTIVPNDPDCEGTWTADWTVEVESEQPLLEWYIQQFDSSGGWKDEDGGQVKVPDGECLNSSGHTVLPCEYSGTKDFNLVQTGHTFDFGWAGLGGGASLRDANNVQLVLTPPATCPTSSWDPTVDWLHSTSLAEPLVGQVYDCVTDYFEGVSPLCVP